MKSLAKCMIIWLSNLKYFSGLQAQISCANCEYFLCYLEIFHSKETWNIPIYYQILNKITAFVVKAHTVYQKLMTNLFLKRIVKLWDFNSLIGRKAGLHSIVKLLINCVNYNLLKLSQLIKHTYLLLFFYFFNRQMEVESA